MGGIYGGKDIRPISQKQDSLHGLINTILDKLPLGVFVKDAEDGFRYLYLAGRFLMRMASRRISKSRNSRLP